MIKLKVIDLEVGYYVGVKVLKGISITAPASKVIGVIGPNGSGKSTLLKAIYGAIRPTTGKILYNGVDIVGQPSYSLLGKGICYVPQLRSIFPNLTVRENLELGAWLLRNRAGELKQAINNVCQKFPILESKGRAKARTLSGGQQRVLEIGRALLTSPSLVLIDEPTVGLAPNVVGGIYSMIQSFPEMGITVILVDQNVRAVMDCADYIYLLELGEIKFEGPREELREKAELLKQAYIRASS